MNKDLERLRQAVSERRVSQSQLAEAAGLRRSTVHYIVTTPRDPKTSTLTRLVAALDKIEGHPDPVEGAA